MKFNNKPTTNAAHAFMLLNAGLNPKTADCYIEEDGHVIIARDDWDLDIALDMRRLSPAWSLSRLLEILPDEIYDSSKCYKRILCDDFISYTRCENGEWRGTLKSIRAHSFTISAVVTMLVSLISEGKYINEEYIIKKKK
nr:MAG TPA_asm: hypothetical protein [Caudoviricetes sp.]